MKIFNEFYRITFSKKNYFHFLLTVDFCTLKYIVWVFELYRFQVYMFNSARGESSFENIFKISSLITNRLDYNNPFDSNGLLWSNWVTWLWRKKTLVFSIEIWWPVGGWLEQWEVLLYLLMELVESLKYAKSHTLDTIISIITSENECLEMSQWVNHLSTNPLVAVVLLE